MNRYQRAAAQALLRSLAPLRGWVTVGAIAVTMLVAACGPDQVGVPTGPPADSAAGAGAVESGGQLSDHGAAGSGDDQPLAGSADGAADSAAEPVNESSTERSTGGSAEESESADGAGPDQPPPLAGESEESDAALVPAPPGPEREDCHPLLRPEDVPCIPPEGP